MFFNPHRPLALLVSLACGGMLVFGQGSVFAASATGSADSRISPAPRQPALISFAGLTVPYDGLPKPATIVTTPANLKVAVTYEGDASAPVFPGCYRVSATIEDDRYVGFASDTLTITVTALVRHAPICEGSIDGSVQMLSGESVALNGAAWISGDLLVPGTPTLELAGMPMMAGSVDATGDAAPANYVVALNGTPVLRYLLRRIDPLPIPIVPAPPGPDGTGSLVLRSSNFSVGDWTTVRDVSIAGGVSGISMPAGSYGRLVVDTGADVSIGRPEALVPDVYRFRSIAVRRGAQVRVRGPVLLISAAAMDVDGEVGDVVHARWMTAAFANGGMTLRPGAVFNGSVLAPNGTVAIGSDAVLTGEVACDRLFVARGGSLVEPAN